MILLVVSAWRLAFYVKVTPKKYCLRPDSSLLLEPFFGKVPKVSYICF